MFLIATSRKRLDLKNCGHLYSSLYISLIELAADLLYSLLEI